MPQRGNIVVPYLKHKMKYFIITYALAAAVSFLGFTHVVYASLYFASDVVGEIDGDGQPLYDQNVPNNNEGVVSERGFSTPSSAAIDTENHRLFVADSDNSRVLVFNLDGDDNLIDRTADYVIGQSTFDANTAGTTEDIISIPYGIAYDALHERLFVSESENQRVTIFDVSPENLENGLDASFVLGQEDFETSGGTASRTIFGGNPQGIVYDETHNRLFFGTNNNRILVYDVTPGVVSNGMEASYVLDQPDFDTVNSGTVSDVDTLNPYGMAYDASHDRLFAVDGDASRILVYDVSPDNIANGMEASYVLGQSTFDTSDPATTAAGLRFPLEVAYAPDLSRLFVTDNTNNRVLVYNVVPDAIQNGMDAEAVIGQSSFDTGDGTVSQSQLALPEGLAYNPAFNSLWVADSLNNRVLQFTMVEPSASLPTGQVGNSYTGSLSALHNQGTVSYAVSSGSLPPGLAIAGSTIAGTPTTAGVYSFTLEARDVGDWGTLTGRTDETITINSGSATQPSRHHGASGGASSARVLSNDLPNVPKPEEHINSCPPLLPEHFSSTPSPSDFLKTLKRKMKDIDVQRLQIFLNTHCFPVALYGPGSLGQETDYFGPATEKALMLFQEHYRDIILKPLGFSKGTGIFGENSRRVINTLLASE